MAEGGNFAPRELQVLGELNAIVSMLDAIDIVLDDVTDLVSKEHERSVYRKQNQVLKSLKKWESMIKKNVSGGGSAGGGAKAS